MNVMLNLPDESRWRDLENFLRYARHDLLSMAKMVSEDMPGEVFERKFRIGEEKYQGAWLELTDEQIRTEIIEELLDAVVYCCMRRYLANGDAYYTDLG